MVRYKGPRQPKFMQKLSGKLISLSNLLPPQHEGFIAELQYHYKHRFESDDTRPPAGTTVEPGGVWIIEAFKIEDFETLKRGLRRIMAAHPRRTRLAAATRIDEIEESLEEIRSSLRGGQWLNIGFIEPNQDPATPTVPLVEIIDFKLYACFQNLAVLLIGITPSGEFQRRFQELVALHCAEEHVFTWQRFVSAVWPFSLLFRHKTIWTGYTLTAPQIKAARIDELFGELTGSTAKLVSAFLPGYFHHRRRGHPSFELFQFEEASAPPPAQPQQAPTQPVRRPFPAFWESLRLDRSAFRTYSDPTSTVYLFDPMPSFGLKDLDAQPVRMLVDRTKVTRESAYHSLQSQIWSMASEWVLGLTPMWTLLNILYAIERKLPDRRDELFRDAHRPWKRWWPFPSAGFRLDFTADWFTFERLRGDFRLRDVEVAFMVRNVPKFSWSFRTGVRAEEFTKRLLAEVRSNIHQTDKVFKMLNFASNEMLQMNVIRSNLWLQGVMLLVAVASLVVAFVTLRVARP